jgi:hypothetical protein
MCVYPWGADLNRGTQTVIDNRTQKVKAVMNYDQYTHLGATIVNVFIPEFASPRQIVKRIIAAKPAGKKLTILKLAAHGDTGQLYLSGTGDRPPHPADARQHRGVRRAARPLRPDPLGHPPARLRGGQRHQHQRRKGRRQPDHHPGHLVERGQGPGLQTVGSDGRRDRHPDHGRARRSTSSPTFTPSSVGRLSVRSRQAVRG